MKKLPESLKGTTSEAGLTKSRRDDILVEYQRANPGVP